jgi:hypothetical protein
VKRTVGATLVEQKERVDAILELRSKMMQLAAAPAAASSSNNTGDSPALASDSVSVSRTTDEEDTEIDRRSDAETLRLHDGRRIAERRPPPSVTERPRRGRGWLVAGGAGALIMLSALGWSSIRHARSAANPADSAAVASSEAAAPQSATVATNAAPPAASSPWSEALVRFSADAPIVALSIGDRAVTIAAPSMEIALPVSADEARSASTIHARAADGRIANASFAPSMDRVELHFPPPGAPAATPRTPGRAAPPKRAAVPPSRPPAHDSVADTSDPPMATNPYAKKP